MLPTVPNPDNIPPVKVTAPEMVALGVASVPTCKLPPLIVQLLVLLPVACQVPPITLNVLNPVYCVPSVSRLKLPVPVPPSWNVSAPAPSTLPFIANPGPNVSVLPPPPSTIAVPKKPVMLPAVKIELPPRSASTPVSPWMTPVESFVRVKAAARTPQEPTPGAADMLPELTRPMVDPTMPKPEPDMLPVEVLVIVSVLPGWIDSIPEPVAPEIVPELVKLIVPSETAIPSKPPEIIPALLPLTELLAWMAAVPAVMFPVDRLVTVTSLPKAP